MGYIFGIAMFIMGCIKSNDMFIVASAIFMAGGAIEFLATKFSKK